MSRVSMVFLRSRVRNTLARTPSLRTNPPPRLLVKYWKRTTAHFAGEIVKSLDSAKNTWEEDAFECPCVESCGALESKQEH